MLAAFKQHQLGCTPYRLPAAWFSAGLAARLTPKLLPPTVLLGALMPYPMTLPSQPTYTCSTSLA